MRLITFLSGLSGLLSLSVEASDDSTYSSRPSICHNPMVRCFDKHHEAAVKFCSNLPVFTSTAKQTVTVTVTSGALYATTTATNAVQTTTSSTKAKQTPYCPTIAPFPCAKCKKPRRQRLACSCIGVPQSSVTVTSKVTETKTIVITSSYTTRSSSSSLSTTTRTSTSTSSSASSIATSSSVSSTTSSSSSSSSTASSTTSSTISSTTSTAVGTTSSTTTSTSAAPTPTVVFTDFSYKSIILGHHNVHRANHSAADLVWDDTMATYAQQTADTCVYAHDTTTGGGGYGQNIADQYSATEMGALITERWYNQEVNYYPEYGTDNPELSDFGRWGHFSQLVWADTTAVGCATKDCSGKPGGLEGSSSPYFTVCNYTPPGNYVGQFKKVGAPLGRPTVRANYGCPTSQTCG